MSEQSASNIPPTTSSSSSDWFATKATEVSNPDLGEYSSLFSGKNAFIIALLILLILSLIGINLLNITGQIVDGLVHIFGPAIKDVLALIGISTGTLINSGADAAADVADLSVDIAKGTSHSIGDLLISASQGGMDESRKKELEKVLKSPKCADKSSEPSPVQSSDSTIAPIGSQKAKAGWCYIGDYAGSRGCVAMEEHDKCMSGQVFPSQSACLYPIKQE